MKSKTLSTPTMANVAADILLIAIGTAIVIDAIEDLSRA